MMISPKGRGYEYAKGAYIPVDDEELDAIAVESAHTIEIDAFVPRAQIDERYLDSPYYITPDDKVGQEAFAVIREASTARAWWHWLGSCLLNVSASSCSSPGTRA
jgi:non-homologous end joining protein Ku